jgi:hypothetical protein
MTVMYILTGCIVLCLLSTCAAPGSSQRGSQDDVPAPFERGSQDDVPAQFEPMHAVYPQYRIDHMMSTISIIGSGSGSNDIAVSLTRLFRDKTDIKVIEPGSLQAIFSGKIIEYNTGLNKEEAQVLAQRFQIDHVLFFEVNTAPYQDYMSGGRAYSAVNLKIVDIKNGETIFQCSSNVGARFADPRPYGYTAIKESGIDSVKAAALALAVHELRYAIGDTMLGCNFDQMSFKVTAVWLGSVAANADVRVGDVIKSVDGVNVSNASDLLSFLQLHPIKQGDEVSLEVERNGQVLPKTLKFPVISEKQPLEKLKDVEMKKTRQP